MPVEDDDPGVHGKAHSELETAPARAVVLLTGQAKHVVPSVAFWYVPTEQFVHGAKPLDDFWPATQNVKH